MPLGAGGAAVEGGGAAAAGRRFWSVREDLEPLLRLAIERLGEGGCLLVTQNRAGPPLGLDRVVERVARRSHRPIACLEAAPPGDDHPTRAGISPILPGVASGDDLLWKASAPRFNLHFLAHGPTPMAAMDCAPRLKNWRREGWQSSVGQPQSEEFDLDFDISLIRSFRLKGQDGANCLMVTAQNLKI